MTEYEKLVEAAEYIRTRAGETDVLLILGSGLGGYAESIDNAVVIPYGDIPNFPRSTAPGHAGRLVAGTVGGKRVMCLQGRFHYYEGWEASDTAIPVRVAKLLGARAMIVTNAAGGVNKDYKPGDLMLITDHIKLNAINPLRGGNIDELGPRFPDMSRAYDRDFIAAAEKCGEKLGIGLREGVYFMMAGPCFETPAEIRAIRILGGDTVGMSTVPEVIAARHAGIRVLGISCVTNMASGILDQPLTQEEVLETGERVKEVFTSLVTEIIGEIKL